MPGLSSLGPACVAQWVAFLDLRIPEERHQAFLPECEENPQNPQQNAMFKYINKTYELGRRLSSVHQARGDKFATGATQPSTPRREKRPKARIKEINILQLNICGITKKKTELAKILHENKDTNNTGKYLKEVCTTTNLSIQQNENSPPTLMHRAHNTLSRPDLTIMSPDLENDIEIRVLPDMGSDHRPTLITIRQNGIPPRQQRSRWNFKKANWEGFRATSEREYRNNSWEDSIDGLEGTFTSIILKSSNLHIPKGSHQKYKPFWNEEIESAVSSRRQARIELEACPTIASKKKTTTKPQQ
ncbi:RNA-directed DNA polymerase from mobile element jockey [Elysia marginata]|uniref:RNA-directed DNA polymerase from mobile element jockey n=1 Tax=Elysia marginata TaxID=1093978 RepID=A0AAV4J0W4_9GAST|nr:RNA-directed DNA polymerase from mobile element jockey [Elysia marginata]